VCGILANRNVLNGAGTILKVIGGLPAGMPAAFEAAHGWGWLVEVLEDYGVDPHLVPPAVQDDRVGDLPEGCWSGPGRCTVLLVAMIWNGLTWMGSGSAPMTMSSPLCRNPSMVAP
jgi:hypothetical protein